MANITTSVSNTNLFTLTNNEAILLTYYIERASCKGNSLIYTNLNSDGSELPSNDIDPNTSFTYQFNEDGLYKLTIEGAPNEEYYVRVTGNIEACERGLIQELMCNLDDCNKLDYCQKVNKMLKFSNFKDYLYGLLNQYQQDQSISTLIAIPSAERLTICQYFCLLADLCGCVTTNSYTTSTTDCGCNS